MVWSRPTRSKELSILFIGDGVHRRAQVVADRPPSEVARTIESVLDDSEVSVDQLLVEAANNKPSMERDKAGSQRRT